MKILLIEPCHKGFGGYFRAINIARSLSMRGNKVTLLYSSPSLQLSKHTEGNLTVYELPRLNLHFFFNLRLLRGFIASIFVVFNKYDVIHAFVPVQLESNIPTIIAKLLGKNIVMDWDDYWTGSDIYGNYKIMKLYVAMCERTFPKIVKNFVVVSDFLYKKSFANGATNVIKIINGINPLTASSDSAHITNKLLISSNCKYVFVLGNTFMRERASQLLRFIDFTASIDDTYVFITNAKIDVIISESLNYDNYNLKNKSSLVSVGHIPPDQLAFYFKKTSFSLFLAGDYDAERANYPIRIGTYISGGNPIVMNDINSEANNTVKKNNIGILNSDLFSLAREMVKLGNDEQRYNDICFNLRHATNFLSWDSLAADLLTYYKNLILKSA